MVPLIQIRLLLTIGMIGVGILMTIAHIEFSERENDTFASPSNFWNVDCFILTTDVRSVGSQEILGTRCYYFVAHSFSLKQWNLVTPEQKNQLMLSQRSYKMWDLVNNNSVNIFWNHMQMWKIASQRSRPLLILEDDASMSVKAGLYIQKMTADMTQKSDTFVLKLFSHENKFKFTAEHPQLQCLCAYFPMTGTLAYIITPKAARILLENCSISTHVDIFLWQEACVNQKIALMGSQFNLFMEKPSSELNIERKAHRNMDVRWWLQNVLNTLYQQSMNLGSPTPYCPLVFQ